MSKRSGSDTSTVGCCSTSPPADAVVTGCGCAGAASRGVGKGVELKVLGNPMGTVRGANAAAAPPPSPRRVCASLSLRDRLGALRMRLGAGRMSYSVDPGLYAVGEPSPESPVLVSANYKLSFDKLRSALQGRDAWVLVLDTQGVNVWCAAGKGTFGTRELIRRVEAVRLADVVSHRKLVVPQLGGPGVSAHQVRQGCGFRVVYGPVRATDLPAFLDSGMTATAAMRRVQFGLRERVVLIPVEVTMGSKRVLPIALTLLLLGGLGPDGYSLASVRSTGLLSAAVFLFAFLGGAMAGPVLLPWLPGRAFALKGAVLGQLFVAGLIASVWPGPGPFGSWAHVAAWVLIVPAVVSFVVMSFTGCSTYTSLSGVLREMRVAVPAQAAAALVGVGLWLLALFLPGGSPT